MTWGLEPDEANKVVRYEIWTKGIQTVIIASFYGSLLLTFRRKPNIMSGSHLNLTSLLEDDDNTLELYHCYDSVVIQHPAGMPVEKSYTYSELRQFEDALESDGFDIDSEEVWIYGPYSVGIDI
jgi:hypothetical protein